MGGCKIKLARFSHFNLTDWIFGSSRTPEIRVSKMTSLSQSPFPSSSAMGDKSPTFATDTATSERYFLSVSFSFLASCSNLFTSQVSIWWKHSMVPVTYPLMRILPRSRKGKPSRPFFFGDKFFADGMKAPN
ncbi:hypothetical protein HAX54_023432 [Datura stramonium]|uniref:Uncharacterized protein n=1 Tax=Datura stramonium TaxID=4076 RepID=A0ABS8S4V2_DATST|nr:hypothetical protein [Datura stramonium]